MSVAISAAAETGAEGATIDDLRDAAIEQAVCDYLAFTEGDLAAAFRIAVADLLDVQTEAEWRQLALDQWVSRGYVRGRALEVLERPHARTMLITDWGA
jgi:hypothetical protein